MNLAMRIDRVILATELARRDWRDKRLAELSGVSRATMSAIKGGKSIAPGTAQKVAHALKMPLEQIIEQEVSQ